MIKNHRLNKEGWKAQATIEMLHTYMMFMKLATYPSQYWEKFMSKKNLQFWENVFCGREKGGLRGGGLGGVKKEGGEG